MDISFVSAAASASTALSIVAVQLRLRAKDRDRSRLLSKLAENPRQARSVMRTMVELNKTDQGLAAYRNRRGPQSTGADH